jgi:hypothetical protein
MDCSFARGSKAARPAEFRLAAALPRESDRLHADSSNFSSECEAHHVQFSCRRIKATATENADMNGSAAVYAPVTSATAETKGASRPAALWVSLSFVAMVGIFVIVAVASDSSLTPDQRTQVFQQSGMHP